MTLQITFSEAMEYPHKISYCRADGSYTDIVLQSGKVLKVTHNLKYVNNLLPKSFFYRSHHSYLVNINSITGFDIIRKQIFLSDKFVVPISKRKLNEITCKINGFSKCKMIS